MNVRFVGKEFPRDIDGHVEDIGDALIAIFYLQRLSVVPRSVANVHGA